MAVDAYHPGYRSATGIHSIPQYSYTDNLGQRHTGSMGLSAYNPKTGKVEHLQENPLSSDWKIGNYSPARGSSSSWTGASGTGSSASASTSAPASGAPAASSPAQTIVQQGSSASSAFEKAIKSLLGGVDEAKSASERSLGHVESADADLGSARKAASAMTDAISNVNGTALALDPYAEILRNLGLDTAGIGDAILSGDASGGGLAAEYLNALGLAGDAALKVTPDRYVSEAAADVQNSFENARGQAERNLSRQGVSASSGAYGALQRQMAASLATALATAKTKARQTGLSEQLSALTSRAGLFKDALTTGAALRQQGAQNVEAAAGIVQKQGDLFATAGQLSNAQSSAFANIGNVEVSLGNLEVSNGKLVQDAIASVAQMQGEMAKWYGDLELAKTPQTTTTSESGRDGNGNYYYKNGTTTATRG